ncbi:MAG: hypothetical protein ABSC23_14595 [Bryobacteraceae bacterium]|jgi:hypothetical protein
MNLVKRLEALEMAFRQDPDRELLDLISRINDGTARTELKRRVAAGTGSAGLLNVAEVMLFAQAQIAELDSARTAELDSPEGTEALQ